MLEADHGVDADVWSVTSFNELRRTGLEADRWNLLHPDDEPRESWVEKCLRRAPGPVVAATDHMRSFADQIRSWVADRYLVLGTDGFGRSDTREELRRFFEVDRNWVVLAALGAGRRGQGEAEGGAGGDREVRHRPGEAGAVDGVNMGRESTMTSGSETP